MTTTEQIPPCAASMGCLCAGHARGQPADSPCDTAETPTLGDRDWYNVRRALVFHYNTLVKKKNRALKGKGSAQRPSELVMEMVDVMETFERVKALHPPPPPAAPKAKRAGAAK